MGKLRNNKSIMIEENMNNSIYESEILCNKSSINCEIVKNVTNIDPFTSVVYFNIDPGILVSPIIKVISTDSDFSPVEIVIPVIFPTSKYLGKLICLHSNYMDMSKECFALWRMVPQNYWSVNHAEMQILVRIVNPGLYTMVYRYPDTEFDIVLNQNYLKNDHYFISLNEWYMKFEFPKEILNKNHCLEWTIKIMNDDFEETNNCKELIHYARLATPTVMFQPIGQMSDCSARVCLPLPQFQTFLSIFTDKNPYNHFKLFHSKTCLGEDYEWEEIMVKHSMQIQLDTVHNHYFASFHIPTSGFIRGVWSWSDNKLYEAKIGANQFYPRVSFSMMSLAIITPQSSQDFKVNVIVYRSQNALPQLSNCFAGSSTSAKFMEPGTYRIRIESAFIKSSRQTETLTKYQYAFRGREFETLFKCSWLNQCELIDSSVIGCIFIEQVFPNKHHKVVFKYDLLANIFVSNNEHTRNKKNWKLEDDNSFKRIELFQLKRKVYDNSFNLKLYKKMKKKAIRRMLYCNSKSLKNSRMAKYSNGKSVRSEGNRENLSSACKNNAHSYRNDTAEFEEESSNRLAESNASEAGSSETCLNDRLSHDVMAPETSENSLATTEELTHIIMPTADDVIKGDTLDSLFLFSERLLTRKELQHLSHPLAERWKLIAGCLQLSDKEIQTIECKYPHDLQECMYQSFSLWVENNPDKCKVNTLYKILLINNLRRIARTYLAVN